MEKRVRVRFAPSPTGPLHIGGVRTALYNYLFAKHFHGDFILRIEDTDQTRLVPGAEDFIYESLKWCGFEPDESPWHGGPFAPYRQSERKPIYKQFAEQLLQSHQAYYAFDTLKELEQIRKNFEEQGKTFIYNQETRHLLKNSFTLPHEEVLQKIQNGENYVIRLKIDGKEDVIFHDLIRGEVKINKLLIDDKVLLKSDGMPTYHLANVVDDYLMKITHVIRGEEWLPSTPLHILLYQALGLEKDMPLFAHLPLLLKPSGKGKLSKRDGDQMGFPVFPIAWKDPITHEISMGYREKGYIPEAFVNFLALQGWNPGTEQEIFSLAELAEVFSLDKVHKAGAKFDIQKAIWFNEQYLRKWSDDKNLKFLQHEAQLANLNIPENTLLSAFHLMKDRISFHKELFTKGKFLFVPPSNYDWATIEKKYHDKTIEIMSKIYDKWSVLEDWNAQSLESSFKQILEAYQEKLGNGMPVLRNALTGESSGPNLFEISVFLGKMQTLKRIFDFIETLKQRLTYKL